MVEIDRHLLPVLEAVVGSSGVRIVEGDAMTLDWNGLLGDQPGWALVANLPYNIATPLVADLLDGVPVIGRMLVMVQREVAERLAAGPGDPGYGAVSVKVAYWAEASVVGRVPAAVFIPRPKVESALVSIRRRPAPAVDPEEVDAGRLFSLVRAGFAKRRKMLRRALAGLVSPSAFETAGVRPEARAEELDCHGVGSAGGGRRRGVRAVADRRRRVVDAPAKLTLSLTGDGEAARRLPPHRRRDGDAGSG